MSTAVSFLDAPREWALTWQVPIFFHFQEKVGDEWALRVILSTHSKTLVAISGLTTLYLPSTISITWQIVKETFRFRFLSVWMNLKSDSETHAKIGIYTRGYFWSHYIVFAFHHQHHPLPTTSYVYKWHHYSFRVTKGKEIITWGIRRSNFNLLPL